MRNILIPEPLALRLRDNLKTYIREVGGCDHPVGICCCLMIGDLEQLEKIIKAAHDPNNPIYAPFLIHREPMNTHELVPVHTKDED